jgi:FKBP-type peptidyl-prolyl cis-trans isomerase 2
MPPEKTEDSSTTRSGDLVRLDFELWSEVGGRPELLDTTREEAAQKSSVTLPQGVRWGPRAHQIGGDYFPAGIEQALVGVPIGEEIAREFAPADAWGERDPNLIELFSMHEIQRLPEMRREDAHLDLGTMLTINGRRGRVVTLTAARVRVDFNPAFAGRKVRGQFKVVERIAEPAEQARAIVELQYGRSAEFHIETHEKTLTLRVPDRSKFDIGWMAAKPRVIDRLRAQLKPHMIRIVEEYVTPVAETKPPETPTPRSEPAPTEAKSGEAIPAPSAPSSEAPPRRRSTRTPKDA